MTKPLLYAATNLPARKTAFELIRRYEYPQHLLYYGLQRIRQWAPAKTKELNGYSPDGSLPSPC